MNLSVCCANTTSRPVLLSSIHQISTLEKTKSYQHSILSCLMSTSSTSRPVLKIDHLESHARLARTFRCGGSLRTLALANWRRKLSHSSDHLNLTHQYDQPHPAELSTRLKIGGLLPPRRLQSSSVHVRATWVWSPVALEHGHHSGVNRLRFRRTMASRPPQSPVDGCPARPAEPNPCLALAHSTKLWRPDRLVLLRFPPQSPFAPEPLPLRKLHGSGHWSRVDGHTCSCERNKAKGARDDARGEHETAVRQNENAQRLGNWWVILNKCGFSLMTFWPFLAPPL